MVRRQADRDAHLPQARRPPRGPGTAGPGFDRRPGACGAMGRARPVGPRRSVLRHGAHRRPGAARQALHPHRGLAADVDADLSGSACGLPPWRCWWPSTPSSGSGPTASCWTGHRHAPSVVAPGRGAPGLVPSGAPPAAEFPITDTAIDHLTSQASRVDAGEPVLLWGDPRVGNMLFGDDRRGRRGPRLGDGERRPGQSGPGSLAVLRRVPDQGGRHRAAPGLAGSRHHHRPLLSRYRAGASATSSSSTW